jgi:hypothetical protein
MAHFAWIDSDNRVFNVTVGVDETVVQNGVGGSTEAWEEYYTNTLNQEGCYFKRTSYNAEVNGFRRQFAGIGYTYDAELDVFIEPSPFPSWTLDENKMWQPPVPKPDDALEWFWNERRQEWTH